MPRPVMFIEGTLRPDRTPSSIFSPLVSPSVAVRPFAASRSTGASVRCWPMRIGRELHRVAL